MSHNPLSPAAQSVGDSAAYLSLLHNIRQLKVPQLKDLCKSLGLRPVAKRKQELVDSILLFMSSNRLAEHKSLLVAIELLVMKLLTNDTIPSFMSLVQSMHHGVVDQQSISNLMQLFRQATNLHQSPTSQASVAHNRLQQRDTPNGEHYTGPMLLFRSTLLYSLRNAVGPPQVLRAVKGRNVKLFSIRLLHNEVQLLNSKENMKLYVFSGVESAPVPSDAQIQFPLIEFYVNGVLTKQFVKGIKGKAGTARPADLTPYIAKDSKAFNVRVIYSDAAENFVLYVYIVEEFSPQSIVDRICARPHISSILTKQTIRQMNEGAGDDDIVVATASLSLRCPITYARIKYPFTSAMCDHIQCFDGLSFLIMQQRTPVWQCPVCSKTIREDLLCVSDYIKEILDATNDEVDVVDLELDGSWKVPTDDGLKNESKEEKSEEPAAHADDMSVEIISLDSDSDEEPQSRIDPLENDTRVAAASQKPVSPVTKESTSPGHQSRVLETPLAQDVEPVQHTNQPDITALKPLENQPAKNSNPVLAPNDKAPLRAIPEDANQDSDDDRVLATYRRRDMPMVNSGSPVDPQPPTPETNNTSDLTPFPESHDFTDAENGLSFPLRSTSSDGGIGRPLPFSVPGVSKEGQVPATTKANVRDFSTRDSPGLATTTEDESEIRGKNSMVNPLGVVNSTSHGVNANQEMNLASPLEKHKHDSTERQHAQQFRVKKPSKDTFNGSSIISTIHDQISRSASPFSPATFPVTTAPVVPNEAASPFSPATFPVTTAPIVRNEAASPNQSIPGTRDVDGRFHRNLATTDRSPWGNSSVISSNTSALTSGHRLSHENRAPENVQSRFQNGNTDSSSQLRQQKLPIHPILGQNNANIGNDPKKGYIGPPNPPFRCAKFIPYSATQETSSHPTTSHQGVVNPSRPNVSYPTADQSYNDAQGRITPNNSVQPLYGGTNPGGPRNMPSGSPNILNAYSAPVPDNRVVGQLNQAYQQGNAQDRRSYQQLIANSLDKINAYHQALPHVPGPASRPPPLARLTSNIARNTAFETLALRQTPMVNGAHRGNIPNYAHGSHRPDNLPTRMSEPAISKSMSMHEGILRGGHSLSGLPAVSPQDSPFNGVISTRIGTLHNSGQNVGRPPAPRNPVTSNYQSLSSSEKPVEKRAEKPPHMVKGLLGIEISSHALLAENNSDSLSENNSFHDDTLQNNTAISLDGHIQDMVLQTPANRKRTIDEDMGSSKRSNRTAKFNIEDIDSSEIIELESD